MKAVILFFLQPYVFFIAPWIAGVILFHFSPETIFSPYSEQYKSLVVWIISLSFIGLIFGNTLKKFIIHSEVSEGYIPRLKYANIIFALWLIISSVEVLQSGGLPLVTHLFGVSGPASSSFGIPTVHGFAQTLYYYSIIAFALKFFSSRKNRYLYVEMLLLAWAIMLFNRGTIIIVFALLFFCFAGLYVRKGSANINISLLFVNFLICLSLLVLLFVAFGNLRGSSNLASLLGVESVSSGTFLWMSSYLISSGVNLAVSLMEDEALLVHEAFNASTGFAIFFYWFGGEGVFISFFLCGVLCGLLTGSSYPRRLIPLRSVLLVGVSLMFFGVFLLNRAFLLLAILCYLFSVVRRRRLCVGDQALASGRVGES